MDALPLRKFAVGLVASSLLLLSACTGNGAHFSILGYTTEPPYDCSIRTVYVPIFQNYTFRRGLEFDLQRAIVREIEAKTPFKVAASQLAADTELCGKIVTRNKAVINANQLNEVREAETSLVVELIWRDLRLGHVGDVLTKPGPEQAAKPENPANPATLLPPPPAPVTVAATGRFIPELGGSITSAEKQMIDSLAVQIVSMMEKGW